MTKKMIPEFSNTFMDQTLPGTGVAAHPLDSSCTFVKMDKPHHTRIVLQEKLLLKR
jgi:hypothetical protein